MRPTGGFWAVASDGTNEKHNATATTAETNHNRLNLSTNANIGVSFIQSGRIVDFQLR
jgi:hypothetical protein